ncbi:multidrug RND transporter [candidate division KSB1 bacterium 4484_87]|nr:MAG: multidrug RND transporter [candidate division KSB1 bacterium 4484_87]
MKERMLKTLAGWHVRHPYRMIILVLVLTLIFGALSEHLQLTMRWSDLLPTNDPRTIEFNKIIDDFVTSTSIIVVVQGEEKQMKKFADELVPKLLAAVDSSKNRECKKKIFQLEEKLASLKNAGKEKEQRIRSQISELQDRIDRKLIQRVDYKNEVDFLKQHGLLLIKENDLKNLKNVFTSPNLDDFVFNVNNSMEAEYIQDSESMSTREKEDGAFMFLDGIEGFVRLLNRYADGENISDREVKEITDKILIGEPYILSYDKSTLVINAIPNFTMLDTDLMVNGTDVIQGIIDQQLKKYPDIRAGLTGFIPVGRDEMYYSQKSLGSTTIIAIIAILILLIIAFRMWVAPIFAMINLIIGIVWAIGVTVIIVGKLNIMTQMMSVILLGLGIDFSIHLISFFTEKRAAGESIADAMEETFLKSGGGVITGGLTTSAAFLTLIVSSSRGMKEMGLVTGFGLLAILVATFLILPIMLVLRERLVDRKMKKSQKRAEVLQRDISFKSLGAIADWIGHHYVFSLISMAIITAFLIWQASKITFDTNYMNIEAEGLTSIALQDTVLDKFDMSMDYSMVLAASVEESRQLAEKFRDLGSVAMVEDISLYLPSKEKQERRMAHIADIKNAMSRAIVARGINQRGFEKIINELTRLDMNVKELQDMAYLGGQDKVDNKCQKIVGDPDDPASRDIILELVEKLKQRPAENRRRLTAMQRIFGPYYKQSILQMCNSSALTIADMPESILDRYANKSRSQFLVTIYPAGALWQDSEFLKRFVDDLETVTSRATGMGPVFRALVEIIGRDGQIAMLLTLVIIFFLLWLDFKHVRDAFLAMIPLGAGILWMVGLMHLTGQQLTVMNVMGLPLILGIGIDDGVHIIHRWRAEKKTNLRLVFASTGKAILLTSLTTMLAFGSLIFAIWRGFGQLGASLFVGVGACFLTTVIILSALIGWISHRNKK